MAEYRTPEEDRANIRQQSRIDAVIAQAVTDGASLTIAMEYGEPQPVVEMWIDRLWDGLRDGLIDGRAAPSDCPRLKPEDDRLAAIISLIEDRILDRANQIRRGLDDV